MLADLRTLLPYARHRLAPAALPPATPWEASVQDEPAGRVRLTGLLREPPGTGGLGGPGSARELALVVHGLGGGPESYYCRRAVLAAAERGMASLCLALRGADRLGEDFYNVAQRGDLAAALASPALARYERVHLLGYSMGGYVVLHYARGPVDPRVSGAVAVCTPLDLHAAQRWIDAPRARIYLRHVLGGLKEIYAAAAQRGRTGPTDPDAVLAVRSMYEWDRLAIAPRYGYRSPEHYYAELSVAPHVGSLAAPALLVAAEDDPVIPADTIRPFLPRAGASGAPGASSAPGARALELRWCRRAGHVAFPGDLDLGEPGPRGLEHQALSWLRAR